MNFRCMNDHRHNLVSELLQVQFDILYEAMKIFQASSTRTHTTIVSD